MRLLLTAGYDRAVHVIALGEILTRQGHEVAGVLVVNPYSVARLRSLMRQRGRGFLTLAVRRLLGLSSTSRGTANDPVAEFLARLEIKHRSLKSWTAARGVPRHVVSSLNAAEAVGFVAAAAADGVVYGGGGILKNVFLKAARGRVLNAHSGPLPQVRGMNACEWSLILNLPPAVTIHYIDRGIDTGAIIERIPVSREPGDDIERLRAKCVVAGVEGLVRAADVLKEPLPGRSAEAERDRQCFVLAPVLLELLQMRLGQELPEPKEKETVS